MDIGFTGTKKGMTPIQKVEVQLIFEKLRATTLHHGDCIGADDDAHSIALKIGMSVVLHPPIREGARAFCKGSIREVYPKSYLARNRDIVDESKILVATPAGPELTRSGTWATVRYARKKNKTIYIIYPTGTVLGENIRPKAVDVAAIPEDWDV